MKKDEIYSIITEIVFVEASMILIITDSNDEHANLVTEKLEKRCLEYFRFNLDIESLKKTTLEYLNNGWIISQNGKRVISTSISCVWFRRAFVEMLLEEKEDRSPDFLIWKGEWNKVLLGFYTSISAIPSLCPLKPSYAAENKFLQQAYAQSIGFNVPRTITSNNKENLIAFTEESQNGVVLKLHSQDFYKVGDSFKGIYVNKIYADDLSMFSVENENPITLQEYIEKKCEVRYTVVDKEHFCCIIDSQSSSISKVDWRRYDLPNTPYFRSEPPKEIKKQVSEILERLGINFGALDFIIDKNDDWYFLEVNPMGQWLWIEDLTGMDISGAIVSWLTENNTERR